MPVVVALAALAWLALWAWSSGPWQRYLAHGDWFALGPAGFLCRAVPNGDVIVPAVIHTLGWLLMIVAMMLPTTLPLLNQFARMTSGRADGSVLLTLTTAGYLVVWTLFGIAAHGLDWLVREAASNIPMLAVHGWIAGSALIAVAGLFQFTALKYRCLEQCRTPISFITSHWRGKSPQLEAFRLGIDHGAFCVGCCWALMLLMFVVGTASIGWMFALGVIMAVEKNMPWGRRLSAPLGYGLLAVAAATVAVHV